MEKTISINLGGNLFYAEEDAYQRLDSYLKEVERYFKEQEDDSEEILKDIETSLAEHFTAAGAGDLKRAVTLSEVEDALKDMGTIHDFSGGNEARVEAPSDGPRRFYRDSEHAVIGGVCSGLGHYFGVDPVWIRLLFALSIFFWGFGVVIYLLIWIAAPEAKTVSEKLVMQGAAVNLSSLSAKMKEGIDSEKVRQTGNAISRFFNRLFDLIGRLIRGIGPLIRILIALFFGFFALAGFVLISLMGVVAVWSGRQYFDPGLIAAIGWPYPWLVLSSVLVLVLPCLAAVFAAIALLRKKNWVSVGVWIGLFLVWFVSVLAAGALFSDSFVRVKPYVEEVGQASIPLQGEADTVRLEAPYYLSVVPGEKLALHVEGHPADISRVRAEIKDKVLTISRDDQEWLYVNYGRNVRLVLEAPVSMRKVEIQGGGFLDAGQWPGQPLQVIYKDRSLDIRTVNSTSYYIQEGIPSAGSAQAGTWGVTEGDAGNIRMQIMKEGPQMEAVPVINAIKVR
ncbi:MAG: PspC domain-containing protein [Bacillota bacterium]